jgi:uncharacterized protein with GYD domain
VTPVEHLGRALQAIEAELQQLEHRADFVRSAIEAFGVDADGLLLDLAKEDAGIIDVDDEEDGRELFLAVDEQPMVRKNITIDEMAEMVQARVLKLTNPTTLYRDGKKWNWSNIATLIDRIDAGGERRVAGLVNELDVSDATAQWMVKRCRELSLIDVERPSFSEQNARERAAAAI